MAGLGHKEKIILALFLGLVFLYSFNALKESDSFYHLKTGELIWQTKSVPHTDVFSYVAYGRPWITHEWLAELIFYGVYAATGFWGLMAFVALLAAVTYYLIFRIAVERGANFYITIISLFFLGYLTFEIWIPRPQVFAFLLFTALLYFLEKYRHKPDKKYLLWAVLCVWLWANMNASVILGVVVFSFYALAEGLKDTQMMKIIGLAAGVAFLISILNPNTYKIYLYSSTIQPAVQTLQVQEWQPITKYLDQVMPKIFTGQMVVVGLLILWWFGIRRGTRDLTSLGVVAGISILPFISIRHVGFWPLVAIPFFASALSEMSSGFMKRLRPRFIFLTTLFLGLVFLGARWFTFPRMYFNSDTVPVYAADFIEANHIPGPLFNLYNEGGYFIWRFWPKEKVFIDGRSEIYRGRPIRDLFTIVGHLPGWDGLVNDKYHINYFILPYRYETLNQSIAPLLESVFKSWPLVYWGDAGLVFVKNSPKNWDVIKRYALLHINPFRPPESIPSEELPAAVAEAQRLLVQSPQSIVVREYVQRLLQSHNIHK